MKNIEYLKTSSSGQVAEKLAEVISRQLGDGRGVLWLLSGGSAVEPAVGASKLLGSQDLSRLSISLVDERYGAPGHQDSNWRKILEAGFEFGNSKAYPILSGEPAERTAAEYNQYLERQLAESDLKLALLGIGADGHTAGIMPNSPAVGSEDYAVYYEAPDYKRLTITPKGLARMDEAVVYCRGDEKAQALSNLGQELPVAGQPAQIIKRIPSVSVYNDLKGAKSRL